MLPKELIRFKEKGRQITILTAWDSLSSAFVEAAGADVVLVGDSLAMFIHGHSTTLPVTLQQMLHHTQAVGRGFTSPIQKHPLVVCDLPFLSYQCGEDKAVAAAGSLLKESCASAVKIEGAEPEVIKVIERLIRMGIPVMGHLGLTPQSVHNLGYHKQAESVLEQEKLISQALQLEKIGCFSLVLEHIPSKVAGRLSKLLKIPVIGIGAGEYCDGQVRVTADLLGLTDKQPPFAKPLIQTRELCIKALKDWVNQKKNSSKPRTTSTSEQESDY